MQTFIGFKFNRLVGISKYFWYDSFKIYNVMNQPVSTFLIYKLQRYAYRI